MNLVGMTDSHAQVDHCWEKEKKTKEKKGGSDRSKQPQRGLGNVQLEKIRLHSHMGYLLQLWISSNRQFFFMEPTPKICATMIADPDQVVAKGLYLASASSDVDP